MTRLIHILALLPLMMSPALAQDIRAVDNPFDGFVAELPTGPETVPPAVPGAPPPPVQALPDTAPANVVAEILAQSRASYGGACGCPDDVDRGGRRCGKRSAYSKSGGASLLCTPSDVTPDVVARYLGQ